MKALPIAHTVKAANVNEKVAVKPLMDKASRLLRRYGKRVSHFIADSQYYSAGVFKTVGRYGAEPVIPHPSKFKEPLTRLYVSKRFRVKGEKRIVELYSAGCLLKETSRLQSWSCQWRSLNGEA